MIPPPADTPPLKKLAKPDWPIEHAYKVSMDKPPADAPSKKKLMKPDRHRASSRIFTVFDFLPVGYYLGPNIKNLGPLVQIDW